MLICFAISTFNIETSRWSDGYVQQFNDSPTKIPKQVKEDWQVKSS